VTRAPLSLTREQILTHRRAAGHLDRRLPSGADSLRQAAWVGLQDSMPRAALLSIHARVKDTKASDWEDPSLVQVWGPRFSAYVVAAKDVPLFTLARLPIAEKARRFAEQTAEDLEAFLAGRRMTYGAAGRAMGRSPNSLRYGAPTGRILIRWEGARQPVVWTVPPPKIGPDAAREELARRYVHVLGPTTRGAFARWAGIRPAAAASAFESLESSLVAVRTPIGEAWILGSDEASFRAGSAPDGGPRLLPSGDAFFLLQGAERELLVPDARLAATLWTPRVWPGLLLVGGEPTGVWRRADAALTIEPWRRLTAAQREAVETEAASLPLAGLEGRIRVRWGE
jgi:hypothetical protein